ncbi:hypothetical protein SNEBB_005863 [Seison nebaliae]|nr:hypothetical protein SNEBB_005863 [Seison nebaliae]
MSIILIILIGIEIVTCQRSKAFNNCPLPSIPYTKIIETSFDLTSHWGGQDNDYIIFECITGINPTTPPANATLTCKDKKWSNTNFKCDGMPHCKKRTFITENGRVEEDEEEFALIPQTTSWVAPGSIYNLICNEGFESDIKITRIKCDKNEWAPLPNCIRKSRCSGLPLRPNAQRVGVELKFVNKPTNGINLNEMTGVMFRGGSKLVQRCKKHYHLFPQNENGYTQIYEICRNDKWENMDGTESNYGCYRNFCEGIPDVQLQVHSKYTREYELDNTFMEGSYIRYHCQSNDLFLSTRQFGDTIACINGVWRPKNLTNVKCVIKSEIISTNGTSGGEMIVHSNGTDGIEHLLTECIFPFRYQNQIFHSCTKTESSRFWCNTLTQEYSGNFMYCDTEENESKYMKCKFPFFYNKQIHYGCVEDDNRGKWCSLTVNLLNDRENVQTRSCTQADEAMAAEPKCQFPFMYKNVRYDSCTIAPIDGNEQPNGPWCSLDFDMDQYNRWIICPQ